METRVILLSLTIFFALFGAILFIISEDMIKKRTNKVVPVGAIITMVLALILGALSIVSILLLANHH